MCIRDSTWGAWKVVEAATCFHDGLEARSCTGCDAVESRVIPANSDNCPSKAFTDRPDRGWYHESVDYVLEAGLMNGMGKGKFEPDTRVTRQQAVTMLYRYAVKIAGIRTDERAELGRFTDSTKINAYAITAMRWAVGSGLMKGYPDNTLQPNGTLTRAEAATLLVWLAAKV